MALSIIAASATTLSIALLVVLRRFYVRMKRIASSSFLFEDYIMLITIACYILFTAFELYICVIEEWSNQTRSDDMETIWKYYYSALLLMDIVMTTIRLDLFLFYRRIYQRVNTSCRLFCVVYIVISVFYLVACIIARTLFCATGGDTARAGFDFDVFSRDKCDDRAVRIGLIVGDFLLNVMVISLVLKTVSILSLPARMSTSPRPMRLLKEASRPCRPMCVVGMLSGLIPLVHLKFAAASDPYDYDSRIKGLVSSQLEAFMFLFVSCMPMLRTLLFPGLTYPSSHPNNPRTKYGSGGSGGSASGGSSRAKSIAGLQKSFMVWTLVINDSETEATANTSGEVEKDTCVITAEDVPSDEGRSTKTVPIEGNTSTVSGREIAALHVPVVVADAKSVASSDSEFGNPPATRDEFDQRAGDGLQPSNSRRL